MTKSASDIKAVKDSERRPKSACSSTQPLFRQPTVVSSVRDSLILKEHGPIYYKATKITKAASGINAFAPHLVNGMNTTTYTSHTYIYIYAASMDRQDERPGTNEIATPR
eukprot:847183-Pyramimonas_sp.AAC.2